MRRLLPVLLLVLAPVAGCGDDSTPPTASTPQTLAPATGLNTPLPSAWPAGLRLPEGSTVVATNDADGLLTVDFETQQLADPVARFLDRELVAQGYAKGNSGSSAADTVTTGYRKGTQRVTVMVTDTGANVEGRVQLSGGGIPSPPRVSASPLT